MSSVSGREIQTNATDNCVRLVHLIILAVIRNMDLTNIFLIFTIFEGRIYPLASYARGCLMLELCYLSFNGPGMGIQGVGDSVIARLCNGIFSASWQNNLSP